MSRKKKDKVQFECGSCGHIEYKWMGRCTQCSEWNSFEEVNQAFIATAASTGLNSGGAAPIPLTEISSDEGDRTTTGFSEFDRVLGGGVVEGELILISGNPGIGKSTILTQTSFNYAEKYGKVLYISGEESVQQIKLRATRLNAVSQNVLLLSETNLPHILAHIEREKPSLVIIDSIQTIVDPDSTGVVGGVSQIKACTNSFMNMAKSSRIPIILVGHVTKDGELAGPRVLEHMVDCTLHFEGSRDNQIRILRSQKNRFGSTDEVGIFEMSSLGLIEKDNPSELFTSDEVYAGSSTTVSMEGTRAIVAEIQSLASQTIYNYPKRVATGVDNVKLTLICASLEKKVGIALSNFDVYVKTVGGLKFSEPSIDLSVAIAIVSSVQDISLPEHTIVLGEVGLVGEVRRIPFLDKRIREAVRLGWTKFVVPAKTLDVEMLQEFREQDIEIHEVSTVLQAINVLNLNGN